MSNIEIVESSPEMAKLEFLMSDDNTTAIIVLIENACAQYQKNFNKKHVPFSYIEFFMEEYLKYSNMFNVQLKQFFNKFNGLNISTEDLIIRYTQSFYAQHSGINVTKEEHYLQFAHLITPTFANEMKNVDNTNISSLTENILSICNKIEDSDELVSVIELYERFMIAKYVKDYNFIIKKQKTVETDSNKKASMTLVGASLQDNYQSSGKITKIIIPKLSLPSLYPFTPDQSRIDNTKRVKLLCSPAKQIVFINKKKIVAVKYSTNFIDKRNKKVKPKKMFDFDF